MKLQVSKLFKLAATGATGLALAQSVHAATRISVDGTHTTNTALPADYGSNIKEDNTNTDFVVSPGEDGITGTPNISLAWSGGGDWEFYNDWPGTVSGGVVQMADLEGPGLDPAEITFTPDNPSVQVVLNEITLNQWGGGPAGTISIDWSVTGSSSGNLASGTYTFPDNGNQVHVLDLSVTGAAGEDLTLSLDRTAGTSSYFAVENLEFDQIGSVTELSTLTSDLPYAVGTPGMLSWTISSPNEDLTLFLDDGNGPVEVTGDTNLTTGEGSIAINPSATTSYSLELTDGNAKELTILAGETFSLVSDATIVLQDPFKVFLDWQVAPTGGDLSSVSLFDGTSMINITGDTDLESGNGFLEVTVPPGATTYTVDANDSGLGSMSVQILRPTTNSAAFSLDADSVLADSPITVSWTGASAGDESWVGIYSIDRSPGTDVSNTWNYLNGSQTIIPEASPVDGSLSFTMPAGEYYAVLFVGAGANTYTVEQGPLLFTVEEAVPDAIVPRISRDGDVVTLNWDAKAGYNYDVRASNDLLGEPELDWGLVGGFIEPEPDETTIDWQEDLSLLPGGAPPVRFYVVLEFAP